MSIINYLRKNGYRPDLCDGNGEKFQKTLYNYLGKDKYEHYCLISDNSNSEEEITEFAGTDMKLLKLFQSSQIKISIRFTELILDRIKEIGLSPKNILDLGGSDGWSSNFIRKKINSNSTITVIDKNKNFIPVEDDITIHNIKYSEFTSEEKFDLVVSILGSPMDGIEDLYSCINRVLSDEGIVFLGLRISSTSDYTRSLEIANNLGFSYSSEFSERIIVFDESVPFICLKRSDQKSTSNEKFIITRKGFFNLSEPRRVYGYEVDVISKFIEAGKLINKETYDFEDEVKFTVEIIEKNDILYRKSYNSIKGIIGDVVIEYPINNNKVEFEVKKQLKRNTDNNIFNNTL